ncbi:MAG: hypothetical protein JMJ93_04385 [Synergistaceae bacterium]|nr:hypothetical protein [Synergistaceae bacterium]
MRKLALSDQADLGGDQTTNLTPAEYFAFLAPREQELPPLGLRRCAEKVLTGPGRLIIMGLA